MEGLPPSDKAGNVIYSKFSVRCSMRLPPTLPHQQAVDTLTSLVLSDPPFNAEIELTVLGAGTGFNAPQLPPEILSALDEAHTTVFGEEPPLFIGCGATIPFMEVFKREFPDAQYMLTGCAFLDSNAHSADENIDLEYCRKVTTVVAELLSGI